MSHSQRQFEPDRHDGDTGVPPGFAIIRGVSGHLFLVCTEDLAASYAIRVVSADEQAIARRVPDEATVALPGVPAHATVWELGMTTGERASRRIVVHRPFGAILAF